MSSIAVIHDTELLLDSRTQKEVSTLSRAGYNIIFCGWKKDNDGNNIKDIMNVMGCNIPIENLQISVKHQAGIKKNFSKLIKYEWRLLRWLKKNRDKYDYIHACNMDTVIPAVLVGKIYHKKVVYDIYDDYADCHVCGEKLHNLIKKIDAFAIEKAHYVIICSEKRKQQLATSPTRLEIIHNSPDLSIINKGTISIQETPQLKIAYVGNLVEGRLIKELVDICAEIDDVEVYIGGDGVLADYIKLQASTHKNIHFYGRLKYEDVLTLEKQCDVVPALYDPSFKNHYYAAPNKFYEAMALGKPTIMVHNTGMDDIVEKETTGLTIDYNKDSLKKAILSIKDNKGQWRLKSKDLMELFDKKYSWSIMGQRLCKIYKELDNGLKN